MPLISALNAATTLCEPGVSVVTTFGLASVCRGAGFMVVGCCTSVAFCESAALVVLAGDAVVRGRTVGEEFEFCAKAAELAVKSMTVMSSLLIIIFVPLNQKALNIAQRVHGVEPWYSTAQPFNRPLLSKNFKYLKHRRTDCLAGKHCARPVD